MSIWKEIKYALNSTLGTDNFRPLDRIFSEYKIWSSGGAYDPNDKGANVVALLSKDTYQIEDDKRIYFQAKFLTPGSFALGSYTGIESFGFKIDNDGNITKPTVPRDGSLNVFYQKNSIVKIYSDSETGNPSRFDVAIYAKVIDSSNVQFL